VIHRYEMLQEELFALLALHGWTRGQAVVPHLESLVREYQQFHGLVVDGWAGPVTARHLRWPRICGHPDRMAMGDAACKWEKRHLRWIASGTLPGISPVDHRRAFAQAWDFWSGVANITHEPAASLRDADVVMSSGPVDRAGKTLAWSELPCGPDRQLQQKYDTGEPWIIAVNPPPGKIDLVRVAAHEIGHAMGIPHLSGEALMAPTYNPRIRKPVFADIREAAKRYGPKELPPDGPNPEPPSPSGLTVFIPGGRVVA